MTHLYGFFWFEHHTDSFITRATLASAGISCRGVSVSRPSVCPSVRNRCSTETAKRKRITQTTPHDNRGTLVF